MHGASAPDVQPPNHDHLSGSSCLGYAGDRAREYAGMVRFIGLLAGVGDNPDDIDAARSAVKTALSQIGFSADEAELRRQSLAKAAEWKRLMSMPTTGMTPQQRSSHQRDVDRAMQEWGDAARPLAEKYSPSGVMRMAGEFLSNLWSSARRKYDEMIAAIRDGTWKQALCRAGVDAGFALLETGVLAALTAIGLGAAAAFLKIIGKVAQAGSKLVRIVVRAERNLVRERIAVPGRQHADVNFNRAIDTDKELKPDEKRLLGEENQGNSQGSPTHDRGPAQTGGQAANQGRWRRKEVAGRRVYQRDDLIDPAKVDSLGRTNLQRMRSGLAPLDADDNPVELHHMVQQEQMRFTGQPGPLAEVSRSFHSDNYDAIHIYPRGDPDYMSWRKLFPEDGAQYDRYRRQYWRLRAEDFDGGG